MENKNNSQSIVIKSGIWYTISNFLLKGFDFLTIPVFSRLLTSEEFGNYNNFVSWVQLIIIIATLSLHTSLLSAQYDFKSDLNNYMSTLLIIGTANAAIICLLVGLCPEFFEKLLSMNVRLIFFIMLYAAVRPAFDMYQQYERLFYLYKNSVILMIVSTISTLILSFVLVIVMKDKFIGRVIGAHLVFIIIGVFLYIRFIIKGHEFKIEYIKYGLKICLPYVPHLLAMTVLSSTDKIMIQKICGSTDTAFYSLAYTCALAISVIWTSLNSAFAPWLGEKLHDKQYKAIKDTSKQLVLIFSIPTIIIIIFSPELLYILGGHEYMSAKFVMPPILLGCLFQLLYSMYVNIEQFCKKTVGMAIASVCAALINIGLNLFFIPIYGYVAAAYTTLIGYMFLMIFHYFLVKRMGLAYVYDNKFFAFLIICEIFVILIADLLYKHNIIRWSVGIVLLGIIFWFVLKNIGKIYELIKEK